MEAGREEGAMRYAVGVDLGGTNVRAGLVSEAGGLEGLETRPVEASTDGAGLVAQIVALAEPLLSRVSGPIVGVGMGVPAALAGPERHVLPGLSNLAGLVGYPFREKLAERLGVPCHLANDANLILLGEAAFGAARGAANVLCLTLGTGIGGGLLLDGKLREGPHGVAGEVGLTRLLLGPQSPLIQRLTGDSRRAVGEEPSTWVALEEVASAQAVGLLAGGMRAEDAFRLAEAGDASAQALLAAIYEALGIAIVNVHLLLDLERVILCGGMAQAGEPLRAGIRNAFMRHCPPEYRLGLEIRCGTL